MMSILVTRFEITEVSSEGNKIANEQMESLEKDKKLYQKDFEGLFRKDWLQKFFYPFKSPIPVIFCLLYSGLQLAFVICAAQAVDDMGVVVTHVLNGGGWVIYYIVALIVGIIANLYTFLVVAIWVAIITTVLVAIALIVALFIGCICLSIMCSSNSNKNNTNEKYTR
jgi:Na+-driven multidrug efflux pump